MKTKRKKFPVALAIIILFSVLYGSVRIGKSISLRNQKLEIISGNKKEISNLKVEIDDLNSELENSSSPDFVEKVAREELGMVKPREVIYVDKNKEKESGENNLSKEGNPPEKEKISDEEKFSKEDKALDREKDLNKKDSNKKDFNKEENLSNK